MASAAVVRKNADARMRTRALRGFGIITTSRKE